MLRFLLLALSSAALSLAAAHAGAAETEVQRGKYLVNFGSCNDCHTPHNLPGKLYVKSRNGFWHSYYFTFGGYHEPIRITPPNRRVTENACRHCHAPIVQAIDRFHNAGKTLDCIRCHASVGHWE